jgi:NitT/TauT family transport system ATP-binding protein
VEGGEILALADINFNVGAGEFVSLLGPSGCGKSTMLKIAAGLSDSSAGRITIDGHPVLGPGSDRAMVFQEYSLFPWQTVANNIEFVLECRGVGKAERREKAREMLSLVHLGEFADKYPHHLSGGMQQRVSIARALSVDPQLLLMDEPFGALDAQTRLVMQQELLRIWERYRKTVLFVTHSIDEALYLSDRVLLMTARPGRIKAELTVTQPRPRNLTSTELIELRQQAMELLADEIRVSMKQETEQAAVPQAS